jgi:tRNA-specific 2-thiouridylase
MRVMAAMSGGVDSSVAAALLARDCHEVVGVTMRLWGGESDTGCCSVSDVDDARRAADALGIEHLVFNFSDDFDAHVVAPYVSAHVDAATPNPCIECNRKIKFARLAERAELLGFDAVATGHHARVGRRGSRYTLERGADRAKDQSYVVHMLGQHDLARTRFPIGGLTKEDVRRRAAAFGLRTATKPDSQDVCFITSTGGRTEFLGKRIPFTPGRIVDSGGTALGTAPAIELVTVGQRKGLGLPGGGPKRYVLAVDRPAGTVIVGDESELLDTSITVSRMTCVDGAVEGDVLVQTSAHGTPHHGYATSRADGGVVIAWDEPQRRVAVGQSAVLYDTADRCVLGGGIAA